MHSKYNIMLYPCYITMSDSYQIHEVTIFTYVGFLFKSMGGGAIIRDWAVIRSLTVCVYILFHC